MGLPSQLAKALDLTRSAIVLALGFVVILVVTRILLRRAWLAIAVTFLLFVALAMPRGEFLALNLAIATLSLTAVLAVSLRFGLLAATTGLAMGAILEAAVLNWNLGLWNAGSGLIAVSLVAGVGAYGFFRALGGGDGITLHPLGPEREAVASHRV